MSHTQFKNGDKVQYTDAVKARSKKALTDKKRIELFGKEILENSYKNSLETFTVRVVICGHTGKRIAQITGSNGRSSNVIDECLVLVK